MIKKISVHQLRAGMYVSDFNAGWLQHPFALNSMKVTSDEQLAKIRESGIRELFIDTACGLDVGDAPTREEAAASVERELERFAGTGKPKTPERQVSLADEMGRARNSFSEATKLVRSIMDDVRLGRQIELESSRAVIEKITASVMRNNNAMMAMRRLKHLDDYTFLHSANVCAMMAAFCCSMGLDLATTYDIALGSLLHDIGKMRVNLSLLNKRGRLTDDEFRLVKSHVVLGSDLLRQMNGIPKIASDPVELHHERFDGSGYPRGLKGAEISRVGRMAAIVDVYDAITSNRCYGGLVSPAEAVRKLFEWSKYHFDPDLVQIFVRSVGIYPVGTLVRLESRRLGIVVEQRDDGLLTPVVRVVFDTKRNHYLPPEDVDLSKRLGAGGADRIVGHESADEWKIDIARFLQ
ncbi:MAG: HD-GYP domain-containing protein [Betaproteobacteria bacterium]|nr:HD-GYP domain-containing protein [Betaproteobacteria bacterium]